MAAFFLIIVNILLFVKRFDFGGAENHTRELANYLAGEGHRVVVVAGRGRQVRCLSEGITYYPIKVRDLIWPVQMVILTRIIRRHRIEVVHAHQRLPIFISCLLHKLTGTPVVATVHGQTRLDLRSSISRKFPDRIIFVSHRILELSKRPEEIRYKSTYIPNGVQIQPFTHMPSHQKICHACRLDHRHAALALSIIKEVVPVLAARHPGFVYRLIGEGEAFHAVRTEAEKTNRRLGYMAVELTGFIENVLEVYRDASMVIGVGRVALEALAHGVPVFCMNHRHQGGMVSLYNYGYLKNRNFVDCDAPAPVPAAIVEEAERCIETMPCRLVEARLLKELAGKDFGYGQIAGRTVEIYRKLVG